MTRSRETGVGGEGREHQGGVRKEGWEGKETAKVRRERERGVLVVVVGGGGWWW